MLVPKVRNIFTTQTGDYSIVKAVIVLMSDQILPNSINRNDSKQLGNARVGSSRKFSFSWNV